MALAKLDALMQPRADGWQPAVLADFACRWLLRTYRSACSFRGLASLLVGVFTAVFFVATVDLASRKVFRDDELLTYGIAAMPTAAAVWRSWLASPDGLPPAVHFTTHVVGSVLGFSHTTARLPDMLGFWVMCLCIFAFLARRMCPLLASIGMWLPMTGPPAYFYAFEMRGYGMVLGFSAAAILCWDLAHHGHWRRIALLALPFFLVAAVVTHLYAVLVIAPLAMAELARTIERRRIDWCLWAGLAVVALVYFPANPMISRIRDMPWLAKFAAANGVSVLQAIRLVLEFLSIPATYLGLLAIVSVGTRQLRGPDDPPPISRNGRTPFSDWVLVVALMALPFIGWAFSHLAVGLLPFRYVIAAVIGFSLGTALLCRAAATRRPELALLLAAWVAITATGNAITTIYSPRTTTADVAAGSGCFRLLKAWEKMPRDGLPIAVTDFTTFNQFHLYGPDRLKQRLVFLFDRSELGRQIESMGSFFTQVFGGHIDSVEKFASSHPSFYIYDCGGPGKLPIVDWLLREGAILRDSGLADTPEVLLRRDLYRVSFPAREAARITQHVQRDLHAPFDR